MLKRRSTLFIDDVMNDINEWLQFKPDDDVENNINQLVGVTKMMGIIIIIIDRTEEDINEDEKDSGVEELLTRDKASLEKKVTRKRLVHSKGTSLDKNNSKPTTYLNGKGHFEVFTGYLGPKSNKNTKPISWESDFPSISGRQRACDTVFQPRSCLLPNTKAVNDVRSFANTFHLFFDEHIMDVIVNKTNTKIANTLSRLRPKP